MANLYEHVFLARIFSMIDIMKQRLLDIIVDYISSLMKCLLSILLNK